MHCTGFLLLCTAFAPRTLENLHEHKLTHPHENLKLKGVYVSGNRCVWDSDGKYGIWYIWYVWDDFLTLPGMNSLIISLCM